MSNIIEHSQITIPLNFNCDNLSEPAPISYSANTVFNQGRMMGWIMEQESFNHQREGSAKQNNSQSSSSGLQPDRFLSSLTTDAEFEENASSKKRPKRSPFSHRLIEKRRRDRMNSSLADLSRLIPSSYIKKGRGRIEKTEIVEMAIKHVQNLETSNQRICDYLDWARKEASRSYELGYMECKTEAIRTMIEFENKYISGDGFYRRLIDHLQNHLKKMSQPEETKAKIMRTDSTAISPSHLDSESYHRHQYCRTITNPVLQSAFSFDSFSSGVTVSGKTDSCSGKFIKKEIPTNGPKSMIEIASVVDDSLNADSTAAATLIVPKTLSSVSVTSESSRYKFKKQIKERFQADSALFKNDFQGSSNLNTNSLSHELEHSKSKNSGFIPDTASGSISSFTSSCISFSSLGHDQGKNSVYSIGEISQVQPGFVLHPSRSFYVPISFNLKLDSLSEQQSNGSFILHPVNIAVNFAINSATSSESNITITKSEKSQD